jgi:hypothetical protein
MNDDVVCNAHNISQVSALLHLTDTHLHDLRIDPWQPTSISLTRAMHTFWLTEKLAESFEIIWRGVSASRANRPDLLLTVLR